MGKRKSYFYVNNINATVNDQLFPFLLFFIFWSNKYALASAGIVQREWVKGNEAKHAQKCIFWM